ncbi:hypothetical protein AB3X96_41225 [Paraburkholderia sp. BR13439]|uniref:hypothetical protein n=1 Tax=unclassified Paraburkholderia TaxID=2615204 RepID=UPI0034CF310D
MKPVLYGIAATASIVMSLLVLQSKVLDFPVSNGFLLNLASSVDFQSALWRASFPFDKLPNSLNH